MRKKEELTQEAYDVLKRLAVKDRAIRSIVTEIRMKIRRNQLVVLPRKEGVKVKAVLEQTYPNGKVKTRVLC